MNDYSFRGMLKGIENQIITPNLKDEMLGIISERLRVSSNNRVSFDYDNEMRQKSISRADFERIKKQFVRMGLIDDFKSYGMVTVNCDFDDFLFRGGFRFQEDILKANLEKLNAELEKLTKIENKSIMDSVHTMSGIVANIAASMPLIDNLISR